MPASPAKKFLARHKALPAYQAFDEADRRRLSKRLPEPMLAILGETGWCAFDDQVIWLTDPEAWEPIGRPWLPDASTACDVLLRSSFGDMVIWGGEFFWLVLPQSMARIRQTESPDWLFGSTLQQASKRTSAARAEVGELEPNQIYTYAPALPLGGSEADSTVAREDAAVALTILSQLGSIRSMDM
jgi:hypothetical protein